MLKKKQLEDAAKCRGGCGKCANVNILGGIGHGCTIVVAQTALEFREMVEDLLLIVKADAIITDHKAYKHKIGLRIAKAEKLLRGEG